jgi:hypothetical protein
MGRHAVVLTAAAVLLAACTTQPAPPPALPGTPTFPDFSHYTPVSTKDYGVKESSPGFTYTFTRFLGPQGMWCGFDLQLGAGCSGPKFPGVSVTAPLLEYGTGNGLALTPGTFDISTGREFMMFDEIPYDHSQLKPLPPMHSISESGVTCGVDKADGIACLDSQGRGFVLSPQWAGRLTRTAPGQPLLADPIRCTRTPTATTCQQNGHGFTSDDQSHRSHGL